MKRNSVCKGANVKGKAREKGPVNLTAPPAPVFLPELLSMEIFKVAHPRGGGGGVVTNWFSTFGQ